MARSKFLGCLWSACASVAMTTSASAVVTAPVLDLNGATLTAYQYTSATPVQNLRPRFDQRGVDIDGTLRLPSPLGWTVNADPLGGGTSAGRTLGDVNLFTGTYNPTDVDLAFPSLGPPVVIGRTYSHVSLNSSNARVDCGGVVGTNWATTTQPEVVLYNGATDDLDVLYLVYGADRYIEFKRLGTSGTDFNTFKAKNGAAGVVYYIAASGSDPEQYLYVDQRGNQVYFFGFDTNAGVAAGQLWRTVDAAGQTSYVGHASNPVTAISSGYTATGRTHVMYDGSARRYTFSYGTVGGVADLLTGVVVEINTGSWSTIASVAYDYYTSTDPTNDKGLAGDLKTVTITHEMGATDYVRTKYYRYYTRGWADSDGRRGEAHYLKMVVGFDGVRQNSSYDSASDSALLPYSEVYFEYASGESRIWKATFNGNCGCAGGTSGTYTFTYDNRTASPDYNTQIGGTTYNTQWAKRTVTAQPDGSWVTQYFDETGAVRGRVVSQGDPAGSPGTIWATDVVRNGSGQVDTINSPENIDTGYTHNSSGNPSGVFSGYGGLGLVTKYVRQTGTTNLNGLCIQRQQLEGTGGTPVTVWQISLSDRQMILGSSGISVPTVATSTNPVDASVTTYSYTYWELSTTTDMLYITPKVIDTVAPAVATAHHGSNASVTTSRYLRADGSTAYTKDGDGILFYTGRSTFGQVEKQISDYNPSTGGYLTGDNHSTWSLSAGGTGTPIHAVTEMGYDDLGRPTSTTRPSAGPSSSTRTSKVVYMVDSGRLASMSFPRVVSTTYYGPVSFTRINHAGKPDLRGTIALSGGSVPSATPNSTDWRGLVETVYDQSGMRVTETHTYTDYSTPTYDTATVGYDSMGRIARTKDVTGTITRTKYNERNLVTERWVGTDDVARTDPAGSGTSDNMVKVEVLAYHQNGWLTDRTQDADGNWSGAGDQRHTQTIYDYRGRAIAQLNPLPPHSVTAYDDLNRPVAVAMYSDSAGIDETTDPVSDATLSGGGTIRVGLTETSYDERGQVYQSIRWEVDPTDGSTGGGLYTDTWYDKDMRPIKALGPQLTKTSYDRLGRAQDRFILYSITDSGYGDADDLVSDVVLEQHHTGYHAASGAVLLSYVVQRKHDDALSGGTTGALHTGSDPLECTFGSLAGRAQISASWYDDWDRPLHSAQYGTNGGTTFTWSSSTPTRSDTVLVTSNQYDLWGRVQEVTDPASVVSRTEYDFAGRRAATIDNYHSGYNPGDGTNGDYNREVDYAYSAGQVTTVTRRMTSSSTADQVTSYTYDTTASSSQIARKNLLTSVIYPPQSTGQSTGDRDVVTTFNALSEAMSVEDPAGNVIDIEYDAAGRVISRKATAASGFDTRVASIATAYNSRGQVEDVQQLDGSDNVLDEITYQYDGFGNLWIMTADPDSKITGGGRGEFVTTNTYSFYDADSHHRGVVLSSTTMPFGAGTAADDVLYTTDDIGRVKTVQNGSYMDLANYNYLGVQTVVGFQGPGAVNNLFKSGGSSDYNTFMDRFNRATTNIWTGGTGSVDFIDMTATLNRYGQVASLKDMVLRGDYNTTNRTFDALYTYDDLKRTLEKEEGELNSGGTAITTRERIETTPRNLAGRITSDKVSLDGNLTYTDGSVASVDAGEMNDSRSYTTGGNKRNELRSRSVLDAPYPSTPNPVTLDYDKNGNLIDDGEKYAYVYDPFGRLVQIMDRNSGTPPTVTFAVYTYNGLGQRISEQLDTDESALDGKPDGVVDSYDKVFYPALDPMGRRVAVYRDTDSKAKEVYYRHPANVRGPLLGANRGGGLIMRERNNDLITDWRTWAADAGDWEGHQDQFCTDLTGNIAALISSDGLVEQYRYSSSGLPLGIPLGDLDCDGVTEASTSVSTEDDKIVVSCYSGSTSSPYQVRADLDLDGDVDFNDRAIVTACAGFTTGRGGFSVPDTRNIFGSGGREVFGEGLHVLWGSGQTRDSGLAISMVAELQTSRTSDFISSGSGTWGGSCRLDCGATGCATNCSWSLQGGMAQAGERADGCRLRDGTCVYIEPDFIPPLSTRCALFLAGLPQLPRPAWAPFTCPITTQFVEDCEQCCGDTWSTYKIYINKFRNYDRCMCDGNDPCLLNVELLYNDLTSRLGLAERACRNNCQAKQRRPPPPTDVAGIASTSTEVTY